MACKTYCVYKHVLPNNKIYIGITKQNPLLRWKNGHGYKHLKLQLRKLVWVYKNMQIKY